MARPPLGIPLDDHGRFAFALMELDFVLQRSGAGRAQSLCDELRSEFDEHVFSEFAELPKQERLDIYYSADSLGFTAEKCSLDHALEFFPQIPRKLGQALPGSPVHKFATALERELDKSAVLEKLRASQERLARPESFF